MWCYYSFSLVVLRGLKKITSTTKWMASILMVVMIVLGCEESSNGQKSFEGVITYKVDIQFTEEIENQDYFGEKFGDSLKISYDSKGNQRRQHFGSGERGYDFIIYNQSENVLFSKWKHIDSIFASDCSINYVKLLEKKDGPTEQILGKDCKSTNILGVSDDGIQKVSLTYFYGRTPYLNSELYEGFKDFFTYDFYSIANSPYMKFIMDLDGYVVTYTAVKIEKDDVGEELFILPNVPIVK